MISKFATLLSTVLVAGLSMATTQSASAQPAGGPQCYCLKKDATIFTACAKNPGDGNFTCCVPYGPIKIRAVVVPSELEVLKVLEEGKPDCTNCKEICLPPPGNHNTPFIMKLDHPGAPGNWKMFDSLTKGLPGPNG